MKKNLRSILLILSMVLVLGMLAACTPTKVEDDDLVGEPPVGDIEDIVDDGIEVEDDFGNKVIFDKVPERIVSLAASHTEILFALGLGDKVVGVTSFCDYPAEALEKDHVGDYNGTNLEKIIELEADLVINYGPGNEEDNKRLEEAGIAVLGYLPESIEEVVDTINRIGLAIGTVEEAKALEEEMLSLRDSIVDKVKDSEKVTVFYEMWHDPLMTAGPGSFMDELINLAGGENIAFDAEGEYPSYDMEQLIERNPQVYLSAEDVTMPDKTAESIALRPGFEGIDAMKAGRVYLLDGNIVSRPGPRVVEALELVAKALHPELFE